MTTAHSAVTGLLPHDPETERSLIGGILVAPEKMEEALSTGLDFSDLYQEPLRLVLKSMLRLASAGIPIDLVTVKSDLQDTGDLERVGGAAMLVSLTDGVARAMAVGVYAERVVRLAQMRRAVTDANAFIQAVIGGTGSVEIAKAALAKSLAEATAFRGKEISWQLLDASSLKSMPTSPPDWAIEPLVPKRSIGFLSAAPKTGKSLLAEDAAFHLAQPRQQRLWLGKYVVTSSRVLYIAREDPVYRLKERAEEITKGYGDLLPYPSEGRLRFLVRERMNLTDAAHLAWLKSQVRDNGFDFLILDVLNRMIPDLDESNAKDMAKMVSILEEVNRDLGVTILCVDHTRKPIGKNLGRDSQEPNPFDLKGSIGKYGCADFMICLARTPQEGRLHVYSENKDIDDRPSFFVDMSPKGSGRPKFTWAGDVERIAKNMKIVGDKNKEKVLDALALVSGSWAQPKEISMGTGLARATVAKHLSGLFDAGKVERKGKGSATQYRIIPSEVSERLQTIESNMSLYND